MGIWAVVPKLGEYRGHPVGSILFVNLTNRDGTEAEELEIGWHFDPNVWGNGIATEAAGSVISRAKQGGVHHLRAVVHPKNIRSSAVCERLGMTYLGLTNQWYQVELKEFLLTL